jgi:ferrous iron transport protein A
MNLTDKKINFEGTIKDLVGDEIFTKRLLELGFIRGERVLLRGIAPFGEPYMIEIRGSVVALRKREAECIQV